MTLARRRGLEHKTKADGVAGPSVNPPRALRPWRRRGPTAAGLPNVFTGTSVSSGSAGLRATT